MNRVVCFLMVGLFFAVLNVSTVSADVPATTGDDTQTGGAFDCATMPDGSAATPMEIENCEASHADSAHAGMAPGTHDGMAPGTVPMCGDAPCPPPEGGGDGVALTIGDPKCIVGAAHRDPGCPNFGQP